LTRYVVGIGNPYMKDDAIGIEVVRALRRLDLGRGVIIMERQAIDLFILTQLKNASKIIIVDALKAGNPPGNVVRFRATEGESTPLRVPLSHESRVYDVIEATRQSGLLLCPVTVVGVEPEDCGVGEGLSEAVAKALPLAVKTVVSELRDATR
jgi:hydrogenase maturation protease